MKAVIMYAYENHDVKFLLPEFYGHNLFIMVTAWAFSGCLYEIDKKVLKI